jgi:hypothetical protein
MSTLDEQTAAAVLDATKYKKKTMREICREGGMQKKYAKDWVKAHHDEYDIESTTGVIVNTKTNTALYDVVGVLRTEMPGYFQSEDLAADHKIDPARLRKALIDVNISERAAIQNEVGAIAFQKICEDWGLTGILDMRKGIPPSQQSEDAKQTAGSTAAPNANATATTRVENDADYKLFTRTGWSKTKQAQLYTRDRLKAERLMQAAGVTLASTKPAK